MVGKDVTQRAFRSDVTSEHSNYLPDRNRGKLKEFHCYRINFSAIVLVYSTGVSRINSWNKRGCYQGNFPRDDMIHVTSYPVFPLRL